MEVTDASLEAQRNDPALAEFARQRGRAAAGLLSESGPFVKSIQGFRPREPQQQMASAVAETLALRSRLIVEAGTGTGKTYAYLVPALLAQCRVLVSTGTKTLQDQLFLRDLPKVRDALGMPVRIALLKGRANYLCRYRLVRTIGDPRWLNRNAELHEIQRWAQHTERGELAELGRIVEDERLARQISSTTDNCLGSRCPDFAECHVVKARRAAQAADVTIVNHHLLLADFALKQQGFGEVLPGADGVIIDEAHQLPDVAAQFLGKRISSAQLVELIRDVREEARVLEDPGVLSEASDALQAGLIALEEVSPMLGARLTLERALKIRGFATATELLGEALEGIAAELGAQQDRSPGLESCAERALAILQAWNDVVHVEQAPEVAAPVAVERDTNAADDEDGGDAKLNSAAESVRWVEPLTRGCVLHATPIRVAKGFRGLMSRAASAWIFTSATLDAGDRFANFRTQLGLVEARTLRLDSPFDFARQARLYLPAGLPDPNAPNFLDGVTDALLPILQASRGGAFVLCTSHRAVLRLAECLAKLPYPLLVQGEADKAVLLARFAAAGNAILVGTSTFWEGVDVRGWALRVVAIDRLPFAAPGDPVQEARLAAIRERGGSPFTEDQLPRAITALRQGAGRLIRDPDDQGLLVLCDPRLTQRGYGSRILSSLPTMPRLDRAAALSWAHQLAQAPPS